MKQKSCYKDCCIRSNKFLVPAIEPGFVCYLLLSQLDNQLALLASSNRTRAAVSAGQWQIRDGAKQQQDIRQLSQDTSNAHSTLAPIFDKTRAQSQLQAQQLVADIGAQLIDIAQTQALARATQQVKQQLADKVPSADEISRAQTTLRAQGKAADRASINRYLFDQALEAKLMDTGFGTGGTYTRAMQAATAVVEGLMGGDVRAALANGAAPYIAHEIGQQIPADNPAGRVIAHGIANTALALAKRGEALGQASGAMLGEAVGLLSGELYQKPASALTEEEKSRVSALATLAAGLAGGLIGDSGASAANAAQAGKVTAENNFLGATSSDKLFAAIDKIKRGDKSLATANDLIRLENADKRSDALASKFVKAPETMSSAERTELAGYLRVYANEMQQAYGASVAQELVKGILSGEDYVKREPDSEAMSKAQSVINTWGYHKSNASIGTPVLLFGSSILGTTIRGGMAVNAAIGVGVNTAVQLTGDDPFSYVDAIMAGITSAATTGKGIGASAVINMGGAAVGSGIKGENPVNSVIGAGVGSLGGSGVDKAISETLKTSVKKGTTEVISAIGGSLASEAIGNTVEGALDEAEKTSKK